MTERKNQLKNQRGQGSVEYVLILALAIAIVLGAIYQLNTAFRFFSDNYFGEYFTCLLETGDLPALGAEPTQNGCTAPKFLLSDGAPKVGDPVGGGSASSDSKDKNSEPDPSDVKGGGGSGSTANADAGDAGSIGPGGSSRGTRTRVRRGRGAGAGKGGEDEGDSSGASASAFADGYDSGKVVRTPVRNLGGYRGRGREIDEKEDRRTKVASSSSDTRKGEDGSKVFKVRVRVPTAIDKEEGVDLGLGNFLRYLIIFIIIIAIVVFIGGQALQVSKNS